MQDSRALLPSSFVAGSPQLGFDHARLLSVAEALAAFFERAPLAQPAVEDVTLEAAAGRVLARDAVAREDIPRHRRSFMDGYAVASSAGTAPRPVAAEVLMGSAPPGPIEAHQAMRVPTGGAIPDGADAVVPQEDCDVTSAGEIVPRELPAAGDYISERGEDIAFGATVLRAGRRIGAPEVGVLATLGIVRIPVFERPRIGIVSTGDELIDPGEPLRDGCVRDSNRYAVAAALAALGAEPVHVPRAADRLEALRSAVREALDACDALVSSGGSSVGERDLVPQIVAELGAPGAIVHGLRVKPGKPTLLAAIGKKPVIGLPGNPASSLMILEAVVRPIVQALCGETVRPAPRIAATAAKPFTGRKDWTWFVPARLFEKEGAVYAEPFPIRSSQTSLLARASGYVTVDGALPRVEAGERVDVILFSCGGAPIEQR
jgi:molybdopterin molybdotransferase